MIECNCGKTVAKTSYSRHLKSKVHLKSVGDNGDENKKVENENEDTGETMEDDDEVSESEDEQSNIEFGIEGDDFLDEFQNDKFEVEPTKDELKEMKRESQILKEKQKLDALIEIEAKKFLKKPELGIGIDDDIFSKEGSEILGKDIRLLQAKIIQYKQMFKKELKGFKVKKNATVEELEAYLGEIEVIINVDSVNAFVLDGIYSSLQMVEGISALTQDWDISGLSVVLKENPQFNHLARQLLVKYGSYSKIAPEYQLTFTIITTAWICKMRNSHIKKQMRQQHQ